MPAKHRKASFPMIPPMIHEKSKKPKAYLAGAVTQPGRNNRESAKHTTGKELGTTSHKKSTLIKKAKHRSSQGQIDVLLRQQLETCPDIALHKQNRPLLVEDISDEDFAKNGGGKEVQPEAATPEQDRPNHDVTSREAMIKSTHELPANEDHIAILADPIEDFSLDKSEVNISSQPCAGNLLTSPAKHKRDTARAARNHGVAEGNQALIEKEVKQPKPDGHEFGTTELVNEGLMNMNSKKQKAGSFDGDDAACPGDGRKNEVNTPIETPLGLKDDSVHPLNPESHCCSYAAVEQETVVPNEGIQGHYGHYGVISAFDGVSSVVRILKQKLKKSPVAIILAEKDEMLRSLVCAEFGYRSDEQSGYTADGAACCYIRDVNSFLKNDCYLLRQAVSMYPDLKWFIIGGSPCQDLTYAGPSQGLLGLVGSQSRLFFVLLCTIRTMQVLVGVSCVRFLVENAGSMRPVHYVAFCRLLDLPHEPLGRYIWELAKHIPFISGKRNFFRNFPDIEPVQEIRNFFDQEFGPLLNQKRQVIPFAPLLRTRAVH